MPISFAMSVGPSVSLLHVTSQELMNEFSLNFILESLTQIYPHIPILVKSDDIRHLT
jgi:hypothetical protein